MKCLACGTTRAVFIKLYVGFPAAIYCLSCFFEEFLVYRIRDLQGAGP